MFKKYLILVLNKAIRHALKDSLVAGTHAFFLLNIGSPPISCFRNTDAFYAIMCIIGFLLHGVCYETKQKKVQMKLP